MSLRHSAALALVGWYLMMPPTPYKGSGPLQDLVVLDAPLSKWLLWSSFDSAKRCEHAQGRMVTEGSQAMHELLKSEGHPDGGPEAQYFARQIMCQCIASDDPRLKEK